MYVTDINILGVGIMAKEEIKEAVQVVTPKVTGKRYQVMNKNNFPFEVTIKGVYFRFGPYETAILTEEQFNHSDFQQQANYFTSKEVS